MTDIQVKYWGYVEDKRHNIVAEGENIRHNTQTETQARNELVETNRSNVARETENTRHNTTTEKETMRNNIATLSEASRHNVSTEAIGRTQASASMIQAGAAAKNADTNAIKAASDIELTNAKKDYQMMENMVKATNLELESNAQGSTYVTTPVRNITGIVGDIFGAVGKGVQTYSGSKMKSTK